MVCPNTPGAGFAVKPAAGRSLTNRRQGRGPRRFNPCSEVHTMTIFSIPIGPHDVPFAGPLMVAACLAFTLAFFILKLLDRVIDPGKHSSGPRGTPPAQVDRNEESP